MRWALCAFVLALWVRDARADSLSLIGAPSPAETFTLEETFVTTSVLTTDFRFLPDGRMVILDKAGAVYVRTVAGELVLAGRFAVTSDWEMGLLGVAVHPNFATNQELFFYYAAADGTDADRSRVVSRRLGDANRLESEETVLLRGLRGRDGHIGGALEIGPDGLLYAGVGDDGCNSFQFPEPPYPPTNFYATCLADDPEGNGGGNGKILRIALDGSIPPDNPLAASTDVTACPLTCGGAISEAALGAPRADVFAWGFRNPFRLWADPRTGRLWVGDVGELAYEEITIVEPGRHHGWPWREATKGHPVDACRQVRIGTTAGGDPIADDACVDPVYACRHEEPALDPTVDGGCGSITGGQIVDSCTWPEAFRGRYVFGDSSTGELWTLRTTAARDGVVGAREPFLSIPVGSPVTIRTGPDGALYVAALLGRILRIAPREPVRCTDGCIADAECEDGDACTTGRCIDGACAHEPIDGCPVVPPPPPPPPLTECTAEDVTACDDGDACTADRCTPDGHCVREALAGLDGIACGCTQPPAVCLVRPMPPRLAARRNRACVLVSRASEVSSARSERRLLRRATALFRRAAQRARRVSDECRAALTFQLLDAAERTRSLLDARRHGR